MGDPKQTTTNWDYNMLDTLTEKPDGLFGDINGRDTEQEFFVGWRWEGQKKCIYAYVALEYNRPAVAVHFEVARFSPSILRSMRVDWQGVKSHLERRGITYIVAANNNWQDTRWPKMLKHFGFESTKLIRFSALSFDSEKGWQSEV